MLTYAMHVELMRPFKSFIPKHHTMWHLLFSQRFLGNPAVYSNWQDEHLNKILKGACRNASQVTFEQMVLAKMKEVLQRSPKRPFEFDS